MAGVDIVSVAYKGGGPAVIALLGGRWGSISRRSPPQPVVAKLNQELAKILQMPETRERLPGHGLIPGGGTPEALGAFLKSEIAKWAKLIKEIGLRVQ